TPHRHTHSIPTRRSSDLKASAQGVSSGLMDRITVSEAKDRQQADQADQQWLGKGLSKEELSFSKLARSYPPIAFAKSIKEQKGGYLTKRSEERRVGNECDARRGAVWG